jgi:outer membrane protein OmpA-like peptidoglycan-associated protein
MRLITALAVAAAALATNRAYANHPAPITRVTLLPSPTGKPSLVRITTGQGDATVLSNSYDSTAVRADAAAAVHAQQDAPTVRQHYQSLLAVQPLAPDHFTLYFRRGSARLTPDSDARLNRIVRLAARRPGGEIVITGYTDRVGPAAFNDALSLQRARAVRRLAIRRGFNPDFVYAFGRGARDPLAPTANRLREPRNRRVEIVVR